MGDDGGWGDEFGKHGDGHGGIPTLGLKKMGEMKKGPASCGAFKSRAMNSRVL